MTILLLFLVLDIFICNVFAFQACAVDQMLRQLRQQH